MNITFTSPSATPLQPTALVIEPMLPHLMAVLSALSVVGVDVTVADTYRNAKATLAANRPELLIAGLKLREYNGLHLISYGLHRWRHLPALVTTDTLDPVLRAETERLGATYVVMPTAQDELVAAICRTALRDADTSDPIRAPFERRSGGCSGAAETSGGVTGGERRRPVRDAIQHLIG